MGSNWSFAASPKNSKRQCLTAALLGSSITPWKQRPGPAVPPSHTPEAPCLSPLPPTGRSVSSFNSEVVFQASNYTLPQPPTPASLLFFHHVGKSGAPLTPILLGSPRWCVFYVAIRMVKFKFLFSSESCQVNSACASDSR